MTTTTHSPVDDVLAAIEAVRTTYAAAPALITRMLDGDTDAVAEARRWIADVDRLGMVDDSLKLYELCGVLAVADALGIIDGELDPRRFTDRIEFTTVQLRRWTEHYLRCMIEWHRAEIDYARTNPRDTDPATCATWEAHSEAEMRAAEAELAEFLAA